MVLEEIESLKARVAALEKSLVASKQEPERWRPHDNVVLELREWFITTTFVDKKLIRHILIKQLAKGLNDDWFPDFESLDHKYYLVRYNGRYLSDYTINHDCASIYHKLEVDETILKILNRGDIDELVEEICGG